MKFLRVEQTQRPVRNTRGRRITSKAGAPALDGCLHTCCLYVLYAVYTRVNDDVEKSLSEQERNKSFEFTISVYSML